MIIKKVKNLDRLYDYFFSHSMLGPDNFNNFIVHGVVYPSEIGIYYVKKKKHLFFYYEDGKLGKDGELVRWKNYVAVRIISLKKRNILIGLSLMNHWDVIIVTIGCILVPIAILFIILLNYIIFYKQNMEIISMINEAIDEANNI